MRSRTSYLTLITLSWILLACIGGRAQTFTISGRVVDKENKSAPGVRVTVQRGAAIIQSALTGPTGDYTITFPAGAPVTIVYAGGGWLPNKVQNLSGRINHSLGKVLSRMTESASLTPAEVDDVTSTFEYFTSYPSLYSQEIAESKNVHLTNRRQKQNSYQPYDEIALVPKKKKLPPGVTGFAQFADRDASDKLVTGGATRGECTTYEQLIECAMGQAGQGNTKEAIELLTQAAKLKPDMFRPHYNLGQIYESQGKYKEAADAYKRAVRLNIDETIGETQVSVVSAYFNLGNVHAMMNEHTQAVAALQEVIRRLPGPYHTAHYNLALSLAALGKHQEAINSFKEATKIKPDYPEAHYNMGVAYSKLEDYPKAIEAFRKAIKTKSGYAEARYNLGLIYYLVDNQKRLKEQQKALQLLAPHLANNLAKLIGK